MGNVMTIHDKTRTDQQAPTIAPDRSPAQLAPGSSKTAIKTCSKCGAAKPATLEYWHSDRHKQDNLSTICKPCRRAFDRIRDPVRKLRPKRRLAKRVTHLNRRAR